MNLLTNVPIIKDEEKFYGYIIGLAIEPNEDSFNKMYVSFQYNAKTQIWMVPDSDLFQILAKHLCSMAVVRSVSDDYGYEKLYIEKKNGKWIVETP